jgi:hypothetical protein
MLILVQYHKFEPYKINIYSVEDIAIIAIIVLIAAEKKLNLITQLP